MMTHRFRNMASFTAALLAATLLSCGQSPVEFAQNFIANRAPVVYNITSDFSGTEADLIAGYEIHVEVSAEDPEGEKVEYSFSGQGSFQNMAVTSTGCTITYIVGNITGGTDVTINVTVTDEKGAATSSALYIATTSLGPTITRTDTELTEITPQIATFFTFQSDKDGYYQIRKNPPTPDNVFDPLLPLWNYSKNTLTTINVYHSLYSGPRTEPPPPYMVLDSVLPDDVYIIMMDKINQYSYMKITYSEDSTPPVPGNSGAIGISNVLHRSLDLSWTKADDLVDPQENLWYKVVFSLSNNLGTVGEAETNGNTFLNWTKDIASIPVTGLNDDTDYYFTVLVKDSLNNKAVYSTAMTTTLEDLPPTPGNSGVVSPGNIQYTSIDLGWTIASDDIDPQGNLSYLVVYSPFNNISNLNDALTNGTPSGTWTTNIGWKSVTGLTFNTDYYFNVIVKDAWNNMAAYSSVYAKTLNDTQSPTPGTISVSSVMDNSMTISWTQASDNYWPQNSLQYRVVISTSDNVGTIEQILDGTSKTVLQDWSTSTASLPVSGLYKYTNYYINVGVRDTSGNMAAYSRIVQRTRNAIYIYSTPNYQGKIGGPSGADTICGNTYTNKGYAFFGVTQKKALLGFNGTGNDIASMPTRYSFPSDSVIRSYNGTLISDTWTALLNTTINLNVSMNEAGISINSYRTGANPNGTYNPNNCSDWTTYDSDVFSAEGDPNSKTGTWLNWGNTDCASTKPFLCICW